MAQAICANASVSMARYTPDSRTANQPKTTANAAATTGPRARASSIGSPALRTSNAAP